MQGIKISSNFVGAKQDIALLIISGYVDTTTCQELAKIIQELVNKNVFQIITDLGGVSYVSSAGWGVFMGEIKNIRDCGGDLKIVNMTDEVFEVFEMLEFHRILNFYDSIEEAIDEFDILRGIDITEIHPEVKQLVDPPQINIPMVSSKSEGDTVVKQSNPMSSVKDLPLVEKVKRIVLEDPFAGIRTIQKYLYTDKYGHVKVGWIRMRSLLKQLNLESKEKRYRFYRSR